MYTKLKTNAQKKNSDFGIYQGIKSISLVLLISIVVLLIIDLSIHKPNQTKQLTSQVFSHRCRSKTYVDVNLTLACSNQLKSFPGIEVDIMWHPHLSTFVLYHPKDDFIEGKYTLLQDFLQNDFVGLIWFDLKFHAFDCQTTSRTCMQIFLQHLQAGKLHFKNMLIEVPETSMLYAFQNYSLKTLSPEQSLWPYEYIFLRKVVQGMAVGGLQRGCFTASCYSMQLLNWIPCLSDAFFHEGGEYLYSDARHPPLPCNTYVSMDIWRFVIYATALLMFCLVILLGFYLYCKYFKHKLSKGKKNTCQLEGTIY